MWTLATYIMQILLVKIVIIAIFGSQVKPKIMATVNQDLPVHNEGWMVRG